MKRTINIHPSGIAYFRADMVREGYVGRVDTIANAVTLTLMKPETSLADVKRSLEITIQDIELRMSNEVKK